jgi:hypothetical protein
VTSSGRLWTVCPLLRIRCSGAADSESDPEELDLLGQVGTDASSAGHRVALQDRPVKASLIASTTVQVRTKLSQLGSLAVGQLGQ